jgi:peptide/nickel transport system substrate-binding protein
MKKFNTLVVLFLILGVLLTACSDESGGDTPSPRPTSVTGQVTPSNNPSQPVSGNLVSGLPFDCSKVFCFGLAQEPAAFLDGRGRFDPANLVDRPSLQISRQIYDTLFEYKPNSMQYLNSSLLKFSEASADGLTYTLRVGKGIRFSDNTPLDAQAIKFNFDRWSDPSNKYHKEEFETYAKYFEGFPGKLESVTADNTASLVRIKLREPMGSFFQVLAMPQFGIVAPSSFNSTSGEFERPFGSGWYVLDKQSSTDDRYVSRGEQKYVVLRENRLYHEQRYDIKDPLTPFVKSPVIVAYVLRQNQDGLEELRRGTIGATDKVRPEQTPEVNRDPTLKLIERKPLSTAFLAMNLTRPPFSSAVVRQAFSLAIDTRSLVRDYYFGLGTPAGSLLPPSTLAYVEQPVYNYEPDRARRLLEVAGFGQNNPLSLDFWVLPVPRQYYPDPRKIATAIAADLTRIGVTVRVRDSYSWTDFRRARQDNSLDFYMFGWQGENGDPDEFFQELYGKGRGEGGYDNPAYQALVDSAARFADLRDRRLPYKELQDTLHRDVLILPLAHVQSVVATRADIRGYAPNPNGIESWATVELVKG